MAEMGAPLAHEVVAAGLGLMFDELRRQAEAGEGLNVTSAQRLSSEMRQWVDSAAGLADVAAADELADPGLAEVLELVDGGKAGEG